MEGLKIIPSQGRPGASTSVRIPDPVSDILQIIAISTFIIGAGEKHFFFAVQQFLQSMRKSLKEV